jgi:hypothetical protein
MPTIDVIAERTHRQGGLVNYTHPAQRLDDPYDSPYAAKGLPVYAALGVIDSMDVMNYNDAESSALFHRLLNCGIHLSASAGTDCFLNKVYAQMPGTERVYVQTNGPLTYAKWIEGLRAGRSFASSMPIVTLTADGKGLGETIALGNAGEVRVKASARCQHPLDKVDVLFNGKVVAQAELADGGRKASLDRAIKIDRPGWIALRATGPGVKEDIKNRQIFAHTSPIYITVGGKSAASVEDARFFVKWVDRLWDDVQARDRIPGAKNKEAVEAEIRKARAFYQAIVDRGE